MNISIQFNREVVDELRKVGIWEDIMGSCVFILIALAEGKEELLDYVDNKSSARRMIILYRFLHRKGLVEDLAKDAAEKYMYRLNRKGHAFVKLLKEKFDDDVTCESLMSSLEQSTNSEMSLEEFCDAYVALWPKTHKCHSKVALIRFEKFFKLFKEYKNYDLVLNATKLYISENKKKDESLTYMRSGQYFIFKAENKETVYDLATWCARYLTEKDNKEVTYDLNFLNTA